MSKIEQDLTEARVSIAAMEEKLRVERTYSADLRGLLAEAVHRADAAEGREAGLREAIAYLVKDYPIDDERHERPWAVRVPLGDLRRLASAALLGPAKGATDG